MDERQVIADRSDPGVRAVARLERLRGRDRDPRIGAALVLAALAIAAPMAAAGIVGDSGAMVGVIVAALLLVAFAVAVWPYQWKAEQLKHHELEAIWREVRSDADRLVPWERYAAWAEPREGSVELALLSCGPAIERLAGAPSQYGRQVVRRLDADDVGGAVEAMDELRSEAAELELRAQQRHVDEREEIERTGQERVLSEIDEAAAAQLEAEEKRLERELAREEAAERQAQAEAVAKAVRRA